MEGARKGVIRGYKGVAGVALGRVRVRGHKRL